MNISVRRLEEIQSIILDGVIPSGLEPLALELFSIHYDHNMVYRQYCDLIRKNPANVRLLDEIPYLPIRFFRSHEIALSGLETEFIFKSSGTTGEDRSRHFVHSLHWYRSNAVRLFEQYFRPLSDLNIYAYLPSYTDRPDSSLIDMVNALGKCTHKKGTVYFSHASEIIDYLNSDSPHENDVLFGVSFALLDLASKAASQNWDGILIETGGMKRRGRELAKADLFASLKTMLQQARLCSEYGMTELMSQCYAEFDLRFMVPDTVKLKFNPIDDPLGRVAHRRIGQINILDLANLYSCPFIQTEDLGIMLEDGSFTLEGRIQDAEIRGCHQLFDE